MMPTTPEPEGPQRLLRCPSCTSEHVTYVIDYQGAPVDGQAKTHFTCKACDSEWDTYGGRMTPANADETMKCLSDLELYGMAFLDGQGRRVHPSMAIIDIEHPETGITDSNGHTLFKPTPVVFP